MEVASASSSLLWRESQGAESSLVYRTWPLFSAITAFAIAQCAKFFITWFKYRRWDPKQFIGSGGMPSSHSATVTALALSIGLKDGFDGSLFAIATIFACIVMHDAFGVRLHAGRQAEVLNQIVDEFPAEHPLSEMKPLHELVGHSPIQVIAGALLGMITAAFAYFTTKVLVHT